MVMVIVPLLAALRLAGQPTVTELSLADALAELDRANPSLAQARERATEAQALQRQAWAALLPSLIAQGSYVANRDEVIFGVPLSATEVRRVILQPGEQLSITGAARLPLVVPSGWFDVAAAKDGARAAEASADAVRKSLRASFAQAAYLSRAAEDLVIAEEAALANAVDLAASARRSVGAGTGARLDGLRAETERVRRESDLAQARANLGRSRLGLGILLGRPGPVRVLVPDAPSDTGEDDDALIREAVDRRPEMVAQRAQVEAAEAQVRSSRALLAPQLSASAAYFAADVPYPTGARDGWRASLDLVWPLYDGGFRYGKRRQAEARVEQARAAADAQRLQIVQEVSDGVRDVRVARERLGLARSQRDVAAEAAATARRGFDAGVASSLDVIDANDRLFQADVGLADARARLASALVALERAVGR